MVGAESNYSPMEKHCLALEFTVKKLRHYLLANILFLISRADPIKYMMSLLELIGRLAKWALSMLLFDIRYIPQKAIKGQALADFLAQHPVPDDSPLLCELPGKEILLMEDDTQFWELYFDGASSPEFDDQHTLIRVKVRLGLVFVTPTGAIIHQAINIIEPRTNNEAEYEALILGVEIAL